MRASPTKKQRPQSRRREPATLASDQQYPAGIPSRPWTAQQVPKAQQRSDEDGITIFECDNKASPQATPKPEYMLVKQSSGQEIDLTHYEIQLGRSPMCTVVVEHQSVAQHHAVIQFKPIMVEPCIKDLGTVSGTFVNLKKVDAEENPDGLLLINGDIITLGDCETQYKFISKQEEAVRVARQAAFNEPTASQIHREQFDQKHGKNVHFPNFPVTTATNRYDHQNALDVDLAQFAGLSDRQGMYEQGSFSPNPFRENSAHRREREREREHLSNKFAQLRDFEQNERLMENMVRRETEQTRKKLEEETNMILQDQKKRDRVAHIEELQRIQMEQKEQAKVIASEAISIKNRNDKLNKQVLDKEQSVLDLQNKLTLAEADNKHMREQVDLSKAKMRALEAFSSDVQQKYDKLEQRCRDKEEQLRGLLTHDLPAKVLEQRAQITSLEQMLMQREVEREAFFGADGNRTYSKQMLEKQSAELVNLRQKVEEYSAREQRCEKSWTDLIKENEFNCQQALAYRNQVEKQRETYNKLLAVTEQRVINANLLISQQFEEQRDFDKKQAADFLSQQIQQLYQERQSLLSERDQFQVQNTDLQRLNVALKCDLEKFTQWAKQDSSSGSPGGVNALVERMQNLQDMLYQQKQSASVDAIVDTSAQIRQLTLELSSKNKMIEQLKTEVQQIIGSRPSSVKRDEDFGAYLTGVVQEKEEQLRNKDLELRQAIQRESDLKEMVKKYEQFQLTMKKGSHPAAAIDNHHQPKNHGGYGQPSFGMEQQPSQAQEDSTTRFIRELREKQAMSQDTQNMYAAGPPQYQPQSQYSMGNGLSTTGNMAADAPLATQEQAKSQWLYF